MSDEVMLIGVLRMPWDTRGDMTLIQVQSRCRQAADKIEAFERDLAHWKANHADMVRRNAALSQRPDLPVDRLPAIAQYEREIAELRKQLAELASHNIAERCFNEALNTGNGSYWP